MEKDVSRVSQELYSEIMKQINFSYLLIRHQPVFKRTKNEREYWNDLLGKEYHFGKNVVNYKKMQPGTKTIWFYTDSNKMYLLGHGDVSEIANIQNEDFVASFKDFTVYNKGSAIEVDQLTQNKIKSLDSWNPYNSIIDVGEQIYNEILRNIQLKTFDDKPLSFLTSDQIKEGYDKISDVLLIPKDKVVEILIALTSGRHILLAGPIGTGKTRLASMIPEIFWEKIGGYLAEVYTATADWNTQDVIGGIYPKMENDKVVYDIQYGCVVETVSRNWELGINGGRRIECRPQHRNQSNSSQEKKSKYRGVWLIIDEFNRADVDKAFGQLFTALRTRSLKIPTNQIGSSYQDLTIPQDYRIIGTLNTADKHFLFQLSDALKSRFAYIEVDIPQREDYDKEIFYALKNAIIELDLEKEVYQEFIGLDMTNRKIIPGSSSSDFYDSLLQAYHFLDSVRAFKKLGTAILQIIYQNMLVAISITRDAKATLDNALTSTLLPQLENLPLASLGVLETFYNEKMNDKDVNIVNYFKDAYKNPNRQSFGESFKNVLTFLQLKDYEKKGEDFSNGRLSIDNDVIWTIIGNAFADKKKSFDSDVPQFRHGITDLRKSAVI
jgi:MoxR-like ATPase